jgi:hypothetical protein
MQIGNFFRKIARFFKGNRKAQRKELTHDGRKIVIDSSNGKSQVTIDGEDIPIHHAKSSDEFIAARHSPHISYESLEELAKHVVEHVVNRRSK